ncbi:MAG: hypothetical protein KAV82_00835 [Phycisphaerae bacterium]|nr:hypothetical protein [Phycisphaerae bacterium]
MIDKRKNMIPGFAKIFTIAAMLCVLTACNIDNLLHQTASFGGDTAGQRGQFRYLVINNTPYRAMFTIGAYDDLDQHTQPQFEQFGNDPDGRVLEGNSTTPTFTFNCARVFAIGTSELLAVIEGNVADDQVDPVAAVPGVYFTDGELGSEEGAEPARGGAPAFEARLGVDFVCENLLIIRLEIDDVGPDAFRIDFEVLAN